MGKLSSKDSGSFVQAAIQNQRMKIAFFTEGYDPFINGVVTMIKAYRQALRDAGHEVVIFTPENADEIPAEDGVIRLPSVIWTEKWYPGLRPFSGVDKIFREGGFDIIHSHHPMTTGFAAERLSKKHGVPLVFTFHTLLPNYSSYLPALRNVGEAALTHIVKRHCAKAHCVTVSTLLMKDWLRDHGIRAPIRLVRPPNKKLVAPPGARLEMREKLRIPEGVPVILCAGRIAPEKCVEFLIEAVARFPRGTDYRLLIVGGGPNEKDVRKLASKLKLTKVIFTGEVLYAEMPSYYAASDIFAFPSHNDTLGLVLIEAMNAGLPCVAVAANGPREVVCDGVTGVLTDPDVGAFSSAIQRLLADIDTRALMGLNGPAWCRRLCAGDLGDELVSAYDTAKLQFEAQAMVAKKRHVVGASRRSLK